MLFLVYGLSGCYSLEDWLFPLCIAVCGFDSFAEWPNGERGGLKSASWTAPMVEIADEGFSCLLSPLSALAPPHPTGIPTGVPTPPPPMKGGGYGPPVGFPMGGWYGAGGIGIN